MSASAQGVASSFAAVKQLRVTLILAQGGNTFSGGGNTLVLGAAAPMYMSASIKAVVRLASELDLRIFGMLQADMNALTVIRWGAANNSVSNNIVQVDANGGNGWQQIFSGSIIEATPDYQNAPDVSFHIQALAGYYAGITPGTPLSYPNGVAVAAAAQTIANAMGIKLINNGVTATLPAGSYFPGSLWDQFNAVMFASNTDFYTGPSAITISPANAPITSAPTVQLSPSTGLIGYPRIEYAGIVFECLYDPSIQQGCRVQISGSQVPAANGTWTAYTLTHELETVKPGGSWFSSVHCLAPLAPS
jgi:hypothetical protein